MRKVVQLRSREEILADLRRLLAECKDYNLSPEQALNLVNSSESVPLSVFTSERGPLESLVIYLHTEGKLDFKTIGSKLGRSYQTVWTSFRTGSAKAPGAQPKVDGQLAGLLELQIPYSIFSNERLSISEALCLHLHTAHKLRYRDISLLLNRDQRTVWTMVQRALKKGEQHEET